LKSVDLGVKVSTGAGQTFGAGFTRNSVEYLSVELVLALAIPFLSQLGTGFVIPLPERIWTFIL
jgi:hypothetical protein